MYVCVSVCGCVFVFFFFIFRGASLAASPLKRKLGVLTPSVTVHPVRAYRNVDSFCAVRLRVCSNGDKGDGSRLI